MTLAALQTLADRYATRYGDSGAGFGAGGSGRRSVNGPRRPQSRRSAPVLARGRSRRSRLRAARVAVFPAAEMPSRSLTPDPDRSRVSVTPRFGGFFVPHPLDPAQPSELPRRFASLTPAQLALARELQRRADKLWRDADGELSLAEAVTIAAVQMGHYETGADR